MNIEEIVFFFGFMCGFNKSLVYGSTCCESILSTVTEEGPNASVLIDNLLGFLNASTPVESRGMA